MKNGKLIFLTGKMGAGKSTYAKKILKEDTSILLSEDYLLSSLYPNEINDISDYVKYSLRIKTFVKWLVRSYIFRGIDVIMDFLGNTIKQRQWFLEIISDTNAKHSLIYLKADDEICLKHLEKRRLELPERNKFDTKEMFFQMKSYFQEPSANEGFNLTIIESNNLTKS
jgi:adenylate kinase family enzyme